MSSWVHDWERALIPKVGGVKAKARTQCKLGHHLVLEDVTMVWLRRPMGLSCEACVRGSAVQEYLEALAEERARTAAPKKVPAARKPRGITHGKPGTYANGCRCTPCREAASAAQAIYRQKRRERAAAAELEGAAA